MHKTTMHIEGNQVIWCDTGEDNYGNQTFSVQLPNYIYRGVKLPSNNPNTRKRRIYLRKNIYINIQLVEPNNDEAPFTMKIGRYKIFWNDTENLGAVGPNPIITKKLAKLECRPESIQMAVAIVLNHIHHDSREWQNKLDYQQVA